MQSFEIFVQSTVEILSCIMHTLTTIDWLRHTLWANEVWVYGVFRTYIRNCTAPRRYTAKLGREINVHVMDGTPDNK